jgi:guanylate kinase
MWNKINLRRSGILFVLSAPSGAGKTTLCDALRQKPDFAYAVSCTTREPRPGEVHGEDYFFVSREEFDRMVAAGEFLEHALVHGNFYGTPRSSVLANLQAGRDVLMDIDTHGADSIRQCDDPTILEALVDVFLLPPGLDELRRRLEKRGTESVQEINTRLANAAREMIHWPRYRYTIISRSIEENLATFRSIVEAERARSRRYHQQPAEDSPTPAP